MTVTQTVSPSVAVSGQVAPSVSVIVPFYNARATLDTALDSLVSQVFSDWEAVLVDDGSDDGSLALATARAASDPRIHVIQTGQRSGVAAARNLGVSSAKGRFIALLDADDIWLPNKLAAQVPVLLSGEQLVFSAYARVNSAGKFLRNVPVPPRVGYADLLKGNPLGCLTVIWDSAHFGTLTFPDLPMHEDYALWLSLLRDGQHAVGVQQVLAHYRVQTASHSARKWQAARATWSILRNEPGLGLGRAVFGFACYAVSAIARRI